MLVCSSFCHKEVKQELNLFRWMSELGGCLNHQCALVVSSQVTPNDAKDITHAARDVFGSVTVVRQTKVDERGWPQSCNALFKLGASHVRGRPFFWIEPDLVPLREGWLNEIDDEYKACGKPFMGYTPRVPFLHLTGCAVYPSDISLYNPHTLLADDIAWDAVKPEFTLPHTYCSPLFQHEWGNHEKNKAPSFWTQRSLRLVRSEACVLHRNKDQTLIKRLRERRESPRWCDMKAMVWM